MDGKTLDYLMSRVDSRRRDSRNYKSPMGYGDSRRMDSRDSRHGNNRGSVDFEGSMDFRNDGSEEWGTDGRYDSRDYRNGSDSRDYRDMKDYHKSPKLSKTDIHHWKQMLENEDGTRGPHYDMQQVMEAADKLNVKFDEFDEKEFCIAVNMMYSDYCKIAKRYVAPDKELMFFAELAKAFLDDEDGPEASEKLALYFHCIVDA